MVQVNSKPHGGWPEPDAIGAITGGPPGAIIGALVGGGAQGAGSVYNIVTNPSPETVGDNLGGVAGGIVAVGGAAAAGGGAHRGGGQKFSTDPTSSRYRSRCGVLS